VREYPRCRISFMTCTKTLFCSTAKCEKGYSVMSIIIVKLNANIQQAVFPPRCSPTQ